MTGRMPFPRIERRSRKLPVRYAILAGLAAGGIAFATLCPIGLRPHLAGAAEERFGAYMALGLASALTFRRRGRQVALLLVVFALGLEWAQELIPGRHARMADAILKALGGLSGSGAGYAVFPLRRAMTRWMSPSTRGDWPMLAPARRKGSQA